MLPVPIHGEEEEEEDEEGEGFGKPRQTLTVIAGALRSDGLTSIRCGTECGSVFVLVAPPFGHLDLGL
jgi:hypothetical protein